MLTDYRGQETVEVSSLADWEDGGKKGKSKDHLGEWVGES